MFKYISILLLFGASLFAQSENDRLDRLEKQIKELNEQNQQQKKEIDALKKKDSSALDKELAKLPEEKDPDPKLNRLRLIEFSGNIMGAVGGSTANNERLEELQGGGHDPRQRGFNLQQIELGISAQIDPFLRAEALILYAEEEVELEEAYILTTALPFDLELELGYMLTEFGLTNPSHADSWAWVDQPVINTRIFGGDGMRGLGARLGWMLPTSWYSQLHLGVQNASGDTMASFKGGKIDAHGHGEEHEEEEEEEEHHEEGIGGIEIADDDFHNMRDLVYLIRFENGFDVTEGLTAKGGLSYLYGPNFTGSKGVTHVYGADVKLRWKSEDYSRTGRDIIFQGEYIYRDLEVDPALELKDLEDWGYYAQVLVGVYPRWKVGLRYELAGGKFDGEEARMEDPFRADRERVSPLISWQMTEFSRWRLQYNHDDSDHMNNQKHSVWLGFDMSFGAHPPHEF